MNKLELIQKLKDKCKISKPEADAIVNLFFNGMAKALKKGDRIEIRGLWSFYIKEYESYIGRNPKTGKKITVPAKKQPFFKCGKELKERVDNLPN